MTRELDQDELIDRWTLVGKEPELVATKSGSAKIGFALMLRLFAEMERTFTAERAAHARTVAEAKGRHIGRPTAWPDDKIDYAQLLREQGKSLGEIASKIGIPKTSLHRYLAPITKQQKPLPA